MKFFISCVVLFLLGYNYYSQDRLNYSGKIGEKKFTLNIESCEFETGSIKANYVYNKSKQHLNLFGNYNQPIIFLQQIQNQDTIAKFYLEELGDSLIGVFIDGTKSFDVKLKFKEGNRKILKYQSEIDFNNLVNENVSGKYQISTNFINYMWVNEENIEPEIAYNGATFTIEELSKDSISFEGEAVCGPTYHIAFAEGIAIKNGENYIYNSEDGCEIVFTFQNKKLTIVANNTMDCGFGARAYLNHQLYKVSDK